MTEAPTMMTLNEGPFPSIVGYVALRVASQDADLSMGLGIPWVFQSTLTGKPGERPSEETRLRVYAARLTGNVQPSHAGKSRCRVDVCGCETCDVMPCS